jgi:transposase
MFDISDDAKGGYRRIEMLTGPGRRRRWSAAEKARIVAETLASGACVSEVARRWQVSPQQVFGWRREARDGEVTQARQAPPSAQPAFVPIVTEPSPSAPPSSSPVRAGLAPAMIEIKIAGAVVRAAAGTDPAHLTAVLRAVRSSASRA